MSKTKVQVAEGKLNGVVVNGYNNVRYLAFRGIPYAKPPVGELRFKVRYNILLYERAIIDFFNNNKKINFS